MNNPEKNCEWCGKLFLQKRNSQRFCSLSCVSKNRQNLRPKKQMKTEEICVQCKKTFSLNYHQAYNKQKFCSTSCAASWRISQPDIRKKIFTEERLKI